QHCTFGKPYLQPDSKSEKARRKRLAEAPFSMDARNLRTVFETILEVSKHQRWQPLAIHDRAVHLHIVVVGQADPDKMMSDYKAYCCRGLKEAGVWPERRNWWTEGGSTSFLWKENDVTSAIRYLVDEQGPPIEGFEIRK